MRPARKLPLPIYGLFHASHLLLPGLYAIIGQSDLFDRPVRRYESLLRPKLQSDSDAPSLRDILECAVSEILQAPLNIEDDVRQLLRRTQGRDVQLTSIGPARMSHLQRALKPASVHRLGARKLQSRKSHIRSPDFGKSIAIVGMAGRFPEAQNVDELWNVLIENRDLHRTVSASGSHIRSLEIDYPAQGTY